MCGFIGYLASEKQYSEDVIRSMAQKIAHRGPDAEGYFVNDDAALGFRRLAIIDLEAPPQPYFNEDKSLALVFNGEIYNYVELREELVAAGHIFETETDSEVIIHGYEEWGVSLLNKLRGMFAFAIYNLKTKKLFAAKDIFGIKPFYYYQGAHDFLFASEIKAFTAHPAFKAELNEERLPHYLTFEYVPDHETLFKNVLMLPAAHYMVVEDGQVELTRYFSYEYHIDNSLSREEWANKINDALDESCKVHMRADVEVGSFLSAGVDSSIIAKKVSQLTDVKTFSIGYEEEKYSELPAAQSLAKAINVKNYSSKISSQDFLNAVPTVQYLLDEPLPNPSAIPLYYLVKNAAEQVKVVVSGEGADELFGGYRYYQEVLVYEPYMKVPQPIRTFLGNVAESLPKIKGRRFLMRGRYPLYKRYIRNNYVFRYEEAQDLLAKPYDTHPPEYYAKPYFDEAQGLDEVTQMQLVDMQLWMLYDILLKADKMSMAHSLELRVPFLDREILKLALSIPTEHRVSKDDTKLALRQAAAKSIPEQTANRPKIGFITPLNDWLKTDEYYNVIADEFTSPVAERYFKVDKLIQLLNDHREGRRGNMKKIWSVYCFLVWYKQYFSE